MISTDVAAAGVISTARAICNDGVSNVEGAAVVNAATNFTRIARDGRIGDSSSAVSAVDATTVEARIPIESRIGDGEGALVVGDGTSIRC